MFESNGSEINITSTKPYTGYLDQGTQHIEARSIFPTGKMPKKWAKSILWTRKKMSEEDAEKQLGEMEDEDVKKMAEEHDEKLSKLAAEEEEKCIS